MAGKKWQEVEIETRFKGDAEAGEKIFQEISNALVNHQDFYFVEQKNGKGKWEEKKDDDNDDKDIKEARTKTQEQIKKMLSESKVNISQLDKGLWENQESWEKYLATLSEKEKINTFLTKMKEAIENQYKINSSQIPPKPKPESKKPQESSWWPIVLVLGLVFLAAVGIVLVIWRRRKKHKKVKQTEKKGIK